MTGYDWAERDAKALLQHLQSRGATEPDVECRECLRLVALLELSSHPIRDERHEFDRAWLNEQVAHPSPHATRRQPELTTSRICDSLRCRRFTM